MFLSNLNGFNYSPSPPIQGFNQRKCSSRVWKEKGSKWFYHSSLSLFLFYVCITHVFFFQVLSQSSFYALFCLTYFFFLLFFSFALFCFSYKKNEKWKKYKNNVCYVYIGTCVPWMAIETKFSKLCISCSLDEHLYAWLSKWALWLLFVISKIKLSLVLNTRITLFYGNDQKNPKRKALITISPLLPANHNMTPVCFGIEKVQYQWHLYASA